MPSSAGVGAFFGPAGAAVGALIGTGVGLLAGGIAVWAALDGDTFVVTCGA